MAQGQRNNNGNSPRGGSWTPRGAGNRGRGFRGRGRGRGSGPGPRGGGAGRGKGGYIPSNETDYILQVWDNNPAQSSYSSPQRGRGRGGGIGSTPERNYTTPSRGYDSPTRPGRGRGRGGRYSKPLDPNTPLSMTLRPLLRPIIFVPATQSRFLFKIEDELIQPIVEDAGIEEQSHIPTAEKVARLFSGSFQPPPADSNLNENPEDLEEIDFADIGKFQEAVDYIASTSAVALGGEGGDLHAEQVTEESFTGKIKPSPASKDTTVTPSVETAVDSVMAESGSLEQVTHTAETTVSSTHIASSTQDSDNDIIAVASTIQSIAIQDDEPVTEVVEQPPLFFIDVDPHPENEEIPISHPVQGPELGSTEPEVVYVPPYPRPGKEPHTPSPEPAEPAEIQSTSVLTGLPLGASGAVVPPAGPAPTVDSISFSFGAGGVTDEVASTPPTHRGLPDKPPTLAVTRHTPARLKFRQRTRTKRRQRRDLGVSSFASRGADVSEAQLTNWKRDPRKDERRRGDSDVDWGDEDDEDEDGEVEEGEEEEEEVQVRVDSKGVFDVVAGSSSRGRRSLGVAEGMDVDPELELDVETMKRFAEGMSPSGSRHVTMDDLDDERKMREEDEDEDGNSGDTGEEDEESDDDDKDLEEILDLEERLLIAEPGDEIDEDEDEDEEDEETSDDDDQSPKSSFQARLDRLRKATQDSGKGKGKAVDKGKRKAVFTDEDSDEDDWDLNRTWAEEDDDFIEHIHDLLDENDDIVNGQDRKAKKKLFSAVYNGDFEDADMWKPARKAKDKHKDLSPELAELWKKDRAKKALYKQERELARLAAAADPLVKKKGGKKGKKAMLAAAKADPTITVLPNRVIDMTTLVQQIHRFIADIGGPNTMALPPANKQTRKDIHELAAAFGIKSQSRGKGDTRYTTLIKTTMTGVKKVNQKKISRFTRRVGDGGEFVKKGERRLGGQRQREGEEIGKAAPKIGETNIGFKMLALMGWSEGNSIGLSGGLQNPLTAVIKLSKKGLGATN